MAVGAAAPRLMPVLMMISIALFHYPSCCAMPEGGELSRAHRNLQFSHDEGDATKCTCTTEPKCSCDSASCDCACGASYLLKDKQTKCFTVSAHTHSCLRAVPLAFFTHVPRVRSSPT